MTIEYEKPDMEGIRKVVYYPTELDKEIITQLNNEIIDILEPLRIEQKAFALAQLISSFEDVSGINMGEVFTSYKKTQNKEKA